MGHRVGRKKVSVHHLIVEWVGVLSVLLLISSEVIAKDERRIDFNIRETQLSLAMDLLTEQAKVQLLYPYEMASTTGLNPVIGSYTLREALQIMFHDSVFTAGLTDDGIVTVSFDQSKKDQEEGVEMQRSKKGFLAVLIGMFSASGAVVTSAENSNLEEAKGTIEEIIVTANRREQNLQDVPMSVTSIDPLDFTETGRTSIGDLIDYTPGVNFDTNGPRGRGQISARGVSQQGNTAVVGIYLDDVPVTASGPYGQGDSILLDAVSGDIERVEILRGPQGTLYGATAIGGAIKYITKKPSTDEVRGRVSVSVSDIHKGGQNKNYSGFVSLPLIQDTLGLTLSGFQENNDGFVDGVDALGNVLERDVNSSDTEAFSADLLWNISDSTSLRFKYLKQTTEYGIESAVNLDGASLRPLNDLYQTTAQLGNIEAEYDARSLTFETDLGFAVLTATTSSVEQENASVRDFTSAAPSLLPGATFIGSSLEGEYDKFAEEIRLTSAENDSYEWILGLFYVDEESQGGQVIDATQAVQPTNVNLLTFLREAEYKEKAIFGNFTYKFTDDFDMTFGARVSDNEIKVDQTAVGTFGGLFQIPLAVNIPDNSETVDTYSLSASYRPTDDLSLYALVASGYRPGSANVPVVVGGINIAPETIDADELWSYEIGAKGSFANGLFGYDVAIWYLDWKDFQTGFSVAGTGVLTNAEDGIQANGFDGSFIWRPFDNLSVTSAVSYIDSTLNGDEPAIDGAAGQSVTRLPEWTASTTARYDFSLTEELDGFVSVGFRYTDSQPSAYQGGTGSISAVNLPSSSFTQWDMSTGILSESYTATLFVTNLFDKVAYSAAAATQSLTGFDFNTNPPTPIYTVVGSGIPVQPRTIGVSFSYKF